jgi:hypothetical protein
MIHPFPSSGSARLLERRSSKSSTIPNDPDSRFTHKAQRCHKHVAGANAKRGTSYNQYAVCNASIGYEGAYRERSKRKGRTR